MEKVRPTLEGMPEELVISILAFLDSDSLAKTSEVCKWLYYLCNDEQIWIRHCRHGEEKILKWKKRFFSATQ